LPDYTIAYLMRQYFPSDAQIIQEDQRMMRMKRRQLEAAVASGSHPEVESALSVAAGGNAGGGKGLKTRKGKNAHDDMEDREAMIELDPRLTGRQTHQQEEDAEDSSAPDYEDDDEEDEDEDEEEEEMEKGGESKVEIVVQGPTSREK